MSWSNALCNIQMLSLNSLCADSREISWSSAFWKYLVVVSQPHVFFSCLPACAICVCLAASLACLPACLSVHPLAHLPCPYLRASVPACRPACSKLFCLSAWPGHPVYLSVRPSLHPSIRSSHLCVRSLADIFGRQRFWCNWYSAKASITWCDLFRPKFGKQMPNFISPHDVLEL